MKQIDEGEKTFEKGHKRALSLIFYLYFSASAFKIAANIRK
jgi:hypothetical protein